MNKPKPKIHVTADVPHDLVEQVDAHAEKLGVGRSFAIRKGLELFLRIYRQDLTEIDNLTDDIHTTPQGAVNAAK